MAKASSLQRKDLTDKLLHASYAQREGHEDSSKATNSIQLIAEKGSPSYLKFISSNSFCYLMKSVYLSFKKIGLWIWERIFMIKKYFPYHLYIKMFTYE